MITTEMEDDHISNNSDAENVEMNNIDVSEDVKMDTNLDDIKPERKSPAEKAESSPNVTTSGNKNWTMAKVQVGYDITRKGERSLVVDGYKFTKSRDGTNNRVFWRCSRRECKATAVTVCDRVEHVRAIHQHDPPLAAEFFSGTVDQNISNSSNNCFNNGATVANSNYPAQRCELQEVRFNTSAANIRGGGGGGSGNGSTGRRRTTSKTELDIQDDNSTQMSSDIQQSPSITPYINVTNPTVKEQVREFILRNTTASNNTAPSVIVPPTLSHNNQQKVAVTQFLIAHPQQQQHQHHQNSNHPPQIVPLVNHQHQQTYNQYTESQKHSASAESNSQNTSNDNQVEQLLHMLLNNQSNSHGNNSTALLNKLSAVSSNNNSNSVPPTLSPPPPGRNSQTNEMYLASLLQHQQHQQQQQQQQFNLQNNNNINNNRSTPVHWKKERLRRDSETIPSCCDKSQPLDPIPRKRKSPEPSNSNPIIYLGPILDSFRPTITAKLIGVVQKLGADLSLDSVVPQDVFEKCTAIKTCLETLEKLHSFSSHHSPLSSSSSSSPPPFTPPQTTSTSSSTAF